MGKKIFDAEWKYCSRCNLPLQDYQIAYESRGLVYCENCAPKNYDQLEEDNLVDAPEVNEKWVTWQDTPSAMYKKQDRYYFKIPVNLLPLIDLKAEYQIYLARKMKKPKEVGK